MIYTSSETTTISLNFPQESATDLVQVQTINLGVERPRTKVTGIGSDEFFGFTQGRYNVKDSTLTLLREEFYTVLDLIGSIKQLTNKKFDLTVQFEAPDTTPKKWTVEGCYFFDVDLSVDQGSADALTVSLQFHALKAELS